jgi:hypothetical protein
MLSHAELAKNAEKGDFLKHTSKENMSAIVAENMLIRLCEPCGSV